MWFLIGIINIVPGDIKKQWLHWDGFQLWRVGHNVVEIDAVRRVIGQLSRKRLGSIARLGGSAGGLLAGVEDLNESTGMLELAA